MKQEEKKPNDKLRRQRELRGWSQKKVGMEIDTSKDMVSRWETGERETSPFYQDKLCTLFGLSAHDLGFLKQEETSVLTPSQPQEVFSLLSTAVSQGIIIAILEPGKMNMNTRRDFLRMLGTSLVLTGSDGTLQSFVHHMMNGDQMALFENEFALRWATYHQGNTLQTNAGLGMWLDELEIFAKEAPMGPGKNKAFTLLSLSYQLQGSIYRDMMKYPQAHNAYKKAYVAADEFENAELKSSALARRGVTFIQQNKPTDAIQYLESALVTIDELDFPCLQGYVLQGLSEAHAIAMHKDQSWTHIDLAEEILARRDMVVEASNCSLCTTSVAAQKGVNAVWLKDYASALDLLERGLSNYDSSLLRGRARLIAQKAEACYGAGDIDESVERAKEAFSIANTIGSQKTLARIKSLYTVLDQSPYRKESSVIQLGTLLATY